MPDHTSQNAAISSNGFVVRECPMLAQIVIEIELVLRMLTKVSRWLSIALFCSLHVGFIIPAMPDCVRHFT